MWFEKNAVKLKDHFSHPREIMQKIQLKSN